MTHGAVDVERNGPGKEADIPPERSQSRMLPSSTVYSEFSNSN